MRLEGTVVVVSAKNSFAAASVAPDCGSMSIESAHQTIEEAELAHLIVATLNLEVAAEEIDPGAPLYSEGLGLDSIDMLEIALVVSQRFGVKLRADDENNIQIFGSLRSLSRFIQDSRDI